MLYKILLKTFRNNFFLISMRPMQKKATPIGIKNSVYNCKKMAKNNYTQKEN